MNQFQKICSLITLVLVPYIVSSQVSYDNNNPFFTSPPGYVGWNQPGANLDFRTSNATRMRILENTGSILVNNQLVALDGNAAFGIDLNSGHLPLSRIHIFGGGTGAPAVNGYRSWMQYGQAFSGDDFDMYVGPGKVASSEIHSFIAWSRSITSETGIPGVLRFVTTDGDGTGIDQFSQDGLEVARMTDEGHVGIGTGFNDDWQPQTTLHVFGSDTAKYQFRISQSPPSTTTQGRKADFQTSNKGNLHIKPSNDFNQLRSVAIGFLPGEQTNPINGTFQGSPIITTLDVGGLTRIRLLNDSLPHSLITGYRINPNNPKDNFLTRLDFPTGDSAGCYVLGGEGSWINLCEGGFGGDLDWEFDNNNVWTGHGLNDFPGGTVTIGDQPLATSFYGLPKLHVRKTTQSLIDFYSTGILVDVEGTGENSIALELRPRGGYVQNWGSYIDLEYEAGSITGHEVILVTGGQVAGFKADVAGGDLFSVGGLFTASGGENATVFGVQGNASGGDLNYGVYGSAPANIPMQTPNSWAGYFDGDVFYSGNINPVSDISLKTDLAPLETAIEIIQQLNPQSYYFQEIPQLNLPAGKQYGFIAQEVEEILPELIQEVTTPKKYDEDGNVIVESITLKTLRYMDLIAILTAAMQENMALTTSQNEMIEAQNAEMSVMQDQLAGYQEALYATQTQLTAQADQITAMQQSLTTALAAMELAKSNMDNCCQNKATGSVIPATGSPQLQQNVPNPFEGSTRIDFSLPETAQVRLEISDSQGRSLETLINGQLAAGSHSSTWDGSRYSPGMYYYSLYANGELLSKKMIKR